MADNFFGFDTNFPPKNVLGSTKGLDDELLTAEVEDEYDALNDETFGKAANDDWEEAHEKLSELITKNSYGDSTSFDDSLLENDESQNEIVSKSISQLGLEDDLDDPAIMSISRQCCSMGALRSVFRSSSPPPPAILETEDCGSPKTHSIWSTTPKDSGISSFIQSLNHSSSSVSCNEPSTPLNTSSDNVFTPSKAWRAEELEKDLLSGKPNSTWPALNNGNKSPYLDSDMQVRKALTGEEVERQILSDARFRMPLPSLTKFVPPPSIVNPLVPPPLRPAMPTFRPNHFNPMEQLAHLRRPFMANGSAPERYFMVNPRMNTILPNQIPLRSSMPNLPPNMNSSGNLNHKLYNFPPRSINHPFLHKQFHVAANSYYNGEELQDLPLTVEDEYAGLMTQHEKDWLIRLQMNQLKFDNPYVEDYYFVTQVARKCQKKYSESATKGSREVPEIILPQTTRPENHTYVPIQFKGSLGKLQAVSVNFPRKVLDIEVTGQHEEEDDNGECEDKVVTNECLKRYRGLLLDIESMYQHVLEIEDEERRILAKPESEGGTHKQNIHNLKRIIFSCLFRDDQFQQVMTVRKGRVLVMRVFTLFTKDQQLQCLVSVFKNLSTILKLDQNDHIFLRKVLIISHFIETLSYPELVQIVDTIESRSSDDEKRKQNFSFALALKDQFGSSVICSMLAHSEKIFTEFQHQTPYVQEKWTKFVVTLSEYLCSADTSALSRPALPFSNLSSHFERFVPNKDKFCLLREKLSVFSLQTDD